MKQCICLERIGDNGPCPVHGDPYREANKTRKPQTVKLESIGEEITIQPSEEKQGE